ncbi:MAG: hypothetical protein ACR2M0_00850 [Chloroflexia bacterium]
MSANDVRPASSPAFRYGLIAVLALAMLPYLNALNAFWVGDDYNYVVPKTLDTVLNFFNPTIGRAAYRPANWLTWAFDYSLFGVVPLGWHLTGLLLYLLNTLFVVLLVRELAKGWCPDDLRARTWVPLLAGAFFAVHPSHPETVTWTGGRADVAFGVGLFLAAWAIARWSVGGRESRGLYALAWIGVWLAIMGKEAGLIAPLALLLVDWAIPERLPEANGEPSRPVIVRALVGGVLRLGLFAAFMEVVLSIQQEGSETSGARLAGQLLPFGLLLVGIPLPWRSRAASGRLARLARDHAPFFAISAAYVLLRFELARTGYGRLMYGTDTYLRLSPETLLNSANGYLAIGLGAWNSAQGVISWPLLLKVIFFLVCLGFAAITVRRLGLPALFALLWIPLTGLVTFNAAAPRWFYVPSMGICLLAALLIYSAGKARPALLLVPALALVLVWGGITLEENSRWVASGQVARGILGQIRALHPDPPRPATFYMANPPYGYAGVLLFNSGFSQAPSFVYQDYQGITGYELEEHAAQVRAALADPLRVGPHPFFLRYENGRLVEYPSLRALVAAQQGTRP